MLQLILHPPHGYGSPRFGSFVARCVLGRSVNRLTHTNTHTHTARESHTQICILWPCVCVCVCLSHFRFDFTHDSLARPTSSSGKHLCLVSYANPFELRHKSSASVHATETAWTAPDSFSIGYQTGWEKEEEELTHKQPKSFAFVLLSGEQRCNLLGFVVAAMSKQKQ